MDEARRARGSAYAPYSHFAVGAALLDERGDVHAGCNVENASFGLTSCAERNAVYSAITSGRSRFTALAIVADSPSPVTPCGACRQVLREFGAELEIRTQTLDGTELRTSISELLPRSFGLEPGPTA
jgi:cytidine deaminase